MGAFAVHILKHHVGSRVYSHTVILIVDSSAVNVQAIGARHVKSISVVAKLVTIAVKSVTSAVVEQQIEHLHIGAASDLEQVSGPVLDLDLGEAATLHIAELDKVIGLVGAAVRSLAIPVLGALSINDCARKTNNLGVGSLEDDGCIAGVRSVLNGHGTGKDECAIGGNLDGESAGSRDCHAAEQNIGAR